MHRTAALALVTVVAAAGLSACKQTEDAASDLPRPTVAFCKAAAKYDERVQLTNTKLAEHIEMVTPIVEHAPDDIADDADLFLDALKKRRAGDTSVIDDPRVETAIANVNRRAGQDCGWYKREGM
jgi:hypothetical protein